MRLPLRIASLIASLLLGSAGAAAPEVARPWIGIGIETGGVGVRVKEVFAGTPGERAGLHAGDEVLAIDGLAVRQPGELIRAISERGIGQKVALRVRRQGGELAIDLALESRPDEMKLLRDRLVDKPAPDFAPKQAIGPHPASRAALAGKVVVLEFWATWCGPCRASIPHLAAWQRQYGGEGLRVVGISGEPMAAITSFLAGKAPAYAMASDEGAGESYRIPAIPMIVVIDRSGVVRAVELGAGGRLAAIEAAFVPLLAARAP